MNSRLLKFEQIEDDSSFDETDGDRSVLSGIKGVFFVISFNPNMVFWDGHLCFRDVFSFKVNDSFADIHGRGYWSLCYNDIVLFDLEPANPKFVDNEDFIVPDCGEH
jgi:hypothetical protein